MNFLTDDRGVVMIQFALALVVLLGFCAFAVDYGVMWVGRGQAQNAADAGALFAATTLAFDDMGDFSDIEDSAAVFATNTVVWGQKPVADVSLCYDPTACPTVPGTPPPEFRSYFSATVSVYRDSDHANALPTYLARVFGVSSQGARAQATATVAPSNVATCVWPLAIPDNWGPGAQCTDATDPPCKAFTRYRYPAGPPALVDTPDVYQRPAWSSDDSGPTGYQLDEFSPVMRSTALDPQVLVELLGPDPANPALWRPARRSAFVPVRIGTAGFQESLTTCNPTPLHLGDSLPVDPAATWSQAADAAQTLSGQDGGATWDDASFRIRGTCAATGSCGSISPRLVLVPLFDPDVYDSSRAGAAGCGGLPCVTIVNFAGFFIDSTTNSSQIVGHLTTYPGRDIDTTGTFPFVGYKWAFLRTAVLTR